MEYVKTFESYMLLEGGGEEAGKLELLSTDVDTAYKYGKKAFMDEDGVDMDKEIPSFKKNYEITKKIFNIKHGTKRKDMPVLGRPDIELLQAILKKGSMDLKTPWSSPDVSKNPFPEGLNGKEAKEFFKRGLKIYDGDAKDDVVNFKTAKVAVKNLVPIQQQIYFDRAMDMQSKDGSKTSRDFLQNKSIFVASSDLRIIDGHHRMLSALLIDPNMKVKVLMIDLPIAQLLPMTVAFSDAVGNKRNG